MDNLQSRISREIHKLSIPNDTKLEIQKILVSEFFVWEDEMRKKKNERSRKFQKLRNIIKTFEEKLASVRNALQHFQKNSDFGISALVEAIHRFWKVMETYEMERNNQNSVVPVQSEFERLLHTVRTQICEKIRKMDNDDFVAFETLVESLESSVDITNVIISSSSEEDGVIDDSQMSKAVNKIGKCSENMIVFLENLQNKYWKRIDEKFNFNPSEEDFESDSDESTIVEEVEEVSNVTVSVNESQNEPIVQGNQPTVNHNITTPQHFRFDPSPEPEKHLDFIYIPPKNIMEASWTGIIKQKIDNFATFRVFGENSETIIVGGIPWKTKFYPEPSGKLSCYIFCELDSRWECTARIKFRVLEHYDSGSWYTIIQTKQFNSTHPDHVLIVPVNDLRILREKTKDVMNIELEITLLAEIGISKLTSLSINKGFELTSGSIIFTVSSIQPPTEFNQARKKSNISKIGNLPWVISIVWFENKIRECIILCNWEDKRDWFCTARIEISLKKASSSQVYLLAVTAKEFSWENTGSDNIPIAEVCDKMNFENSFDEERLITFDVNILIFQEKTS